MKRLSQIVFSFAAFLCLVACSQPNAVRDEPGSEAKTEERTDIESQEGDKIDMVQVIIGNQRFDMTLADTKAAQEFAAMLPLEVTMEDVNSNEKYLALKKNFTTDNHPAGQISVGDVKLWAGDGLVIFYEEFHSSYSYTDLGHIENSADLPAVLGNGSVSVRFEIGDE